MSEHALSSLDSESCTSRMITVLDVKMRGLQSRGLIFLWVHHHMMTCSHGEAH